MNQMNWASQCLGPAVQNVNLLSWAKSKPNPSEVGQLCQNTKMPRYAEDIHAPKERSIWEENSLSKTSSPSRTLPHARYLNSTTSGPMKRGTTLTTLPINSPLMHRYDLTANCSQSLSLSSDFLT